MPISSWQETESDGGIMPMRVSVPDGSGPFPALVVIQHQGGVDNFVQNLTERLAADGFVAAAPALYHRDGPDYPDDAKTRSSRLRDKNVINDVNATVSFLQRQNNIDGQRMGIIGLCMGGRVVYLMAASNPAFKAAVIYYGGNIFRPWGRDIPSPFERTAEIRCPLLGHFGEDDKNPSPEDMRRLEAELKKFAKVHEFYSYPDSGHAFMDSTKVSYRPHADLASWPRTVAFLSRHLVER
jgi:carboxymethylenebutenolidase